MSIPPLERENSTCATRLDRAVVLCTVRRSYVRRLSVKCFLVVHIVQSISSMDESLCTVYVVKFVLGRAASLTNYPTFVYD